MAIDTKELRRLAQAALIGPDGVSLNWLKLLQDFQKEANPSVICELIDRLEAAEKDRSNFIVEMGKLCAQCDALCLRIKAAEKERDVLRDRLALESQENGALRDSVDRACEERDALRAKITEMERQEIGFRERCTPSFPTKYNNRFPLYALPGAKGEKK